VSRLRKYTNSLFSTYILLGVNGLYTLASIPLALKYLDKAEFGLWILTTQIATYIALVDFGMNSSMTRALIEYKDQRESGQYGSAIKSGLLVGLFQGVIVLFIGLGLLSFMGVLFKIPPEQTKNFLWLMTGQILVAAGSMVSRVFNQLLYAWQRIDIYNYIQAAQIMGGFIVLGFGFYFGMGVFSLLAGSIAGWLLSGIVSFFMCSHLGFWPEKGEWGGLSRKLFYELFSYGADVFMLAVGSQLVLSSQTILISRELGMEAAAVWAVMTKGFVLAGQLVWRIIANAMPAFAEMQVRHEMERLWNRYQSFFLVINVFAVICAVLFASCNTIFVSIWTQGKISWPSFNDVLLAGWFLALTQQCCHNSLILFLKQIKRLKYVFLVEGIVFIGVALLVLRQGGITGMLVCSLLGTILFTWGNGAWRVSRLANKNLKVVFWDWQLPLIQLLGILVACWLVAKWLLADAPLLLQLFLMSAFLTMAGLFIATRYILPRSLMDELIAKLPFPVQRLALLFLSLICKKCKDACHAQIL
jgi:O-antigen/teichoic acid export membrane protein